MKFEEKIMFKDNMLTQKIWWLNNSKNILQSQHLLLNSYVFKDDLGPF